MEESSLYFFLLNLSSAPCSTCQWISKKKELKNWSLIKWLHTTSTSVCISTEILLYNVGKIRDKNALALHISLSEFMSYHRVVTRCVSAHQTAPVFHTKNPVLKCTQGSWKSSFPMWQITFKVTDRNPHFLREPHGPEDSKQCGQSESNRALQHCDSQLFSADVNTLPVSSNSRPDTEPTMTTDTEDLQGLLQLKYCL